MKTKNLQILLINSKFTKNITTFVKAAENDGYLVGNSNINEYNLPDVLEDALKLNNIVVTVGAADEVCKVVSKIFNEPLVESSVLPFLLPTHLKILSLDVLHTPGLFVVVNEIGINSLIEIVIKNRKDIEFTKIIKVTLNDSLHKHLQKLKESENGLQVYIQEGCNVVIKSKNFNDVIAVVKKLQDFSTNIISNTFYDESFNLLHLSEDQVIKSAIEIVQDCFKQYGPENVFISFNGGKDCTVLLHIMLAVLHKSYPNYSKRPFCMYVQSENPFPELNDFIENVSLYYNLNIITITSGIKEALQSILNTKPNFKAVFLGTRRMDPFSQNMQHFQMTDQNWPSIMRVNPLLDWDYVHIWNYLLNFGVPYCSLYDDGFTSLGNINNTIKNPMLFYQKNGDEFYLPAYKLFDGTKERLGRT